MRSSLHLLFILSVTVCYLGISSSAKFDSSETGTANTASTDRSLHGFGITPYDPIRDSARDNPSLFSHPDSASEVERNRPSVNGFADSQDPITGPITETSSDGDAPDSDPLHRIKHVVVLVMENRSFDHLLGCLERDDLDTFRGREKELFNLVNTTDPNSTKIFPSCGAPRIAPQSPEHEVGYVTEQMYGKRHFESPPYQVPPMSGFVQDNFNGADESLETVSEIMRAFDPQEISVIRDLVNEFAVFNRWFSSVPGPTQPNRSYLHTATSGGRVDNNNMQIQFGYPQKTIYQSLFEANKDFRIYYHDAPTSILYRWMRYPSNLMKTKSFAANWRHDVAKGDLKEYTFIDPRYFDHELLSSVWLANDDHPPHDIRNGQILIKEVYEALRASPVWNSTLLLITYDEHGGYYDHVPPPVSGVPNPDGKVGDGLLFDRLGVRVPTIAISPWIKRGLVVSNPKGPKRTSAYEHSSVPATLKKLFGLPNFLTERDAWAGTFESLWMDLPAPRTDCPLTVGDFGTTRHMRRSLELPLNGKPDFTGDLTDMQETTLYIVGGMLNATNSELKKMDKREAADFVRNGFAQLQSMAEDSLHSSL